MVAAGSSRIRVTVAASTALAVSVSTGVAVASAPAPSPVALLAVTRTVWATPLVRPAMVSPELKSVDCRVVS